MKKVKSILIVFVLLAGALSAQNNVTSETFLTKLTNDQKGFLENTWYESPSESSKNTVVYRLTPYVVVAGQDYSPFPPSKIVLNQQKTFNGEYIKTTSKTDPLQTLSGNWILDKNNLLLNSNNQTSKVTIVSIVVDKLVVSID